MAHSPGFQSKPAIWASRLVPLALSIFYLAFAVQLPVGTLTHPELGLFPLICGIVLLMGSIMVLIPSRAAETQSLLEEDAEEDETHVGDTAWRVPVLAGIMVVYVIGTVMVGHLIASAVCGFAILRLVSRMTLWKQVLISVTIAVASFLLFNNLLGVRLPLWGAL